MRLICSFFLAVSCLVAPLSASENRGDSFSYLTNTDELYRAGAGSEDGAFAAISTSMLGWGVGLALGIGILASVLHQSSSSHSHAHTSSD